MDWDHEQTSAQRGYSSMELPNRNARQDTFVMWVLDSEINLSCLSSSSMRDFLKVIAPNLSSVTPKKFLYEWLPETQERVSSYVRSRLRNQRVMLIVEEGSRSHHAFCNIYVTLDLSSSHPGTLLLPETFLLKRLTPTKLQIEDLTVAISSSVIELSAENIEVKSIVFDNCKFIRDIERSVNLNLPRPVRGLISAVHILRNVLCEMVKRDPSLASLWASVKELTHVATESLDCALLLLKKRENFPYEEIAWKKEWLWRYLGMFVLTG